MTDRLERLTLQAMVTKLGLHIGARIKQAREEAGFPTQQALADKLPSPINNQYISKWEKGVKPKEQNLRLIADAVGKDLGWFYEGFEKTAPTPDLSRSNGSADLEAQLDRIEAKLDQILEDPGVWLKKLWDAAGTTPPAQQSQVADGPSPAQG